MAEDSGFIEEIEKGKNEVAVQVWNESLLEHIASVPCGHLRVKEEMKGNLPVSGPSSGPRQQGSSCLRREPLSLGSPVYSLGVIGRGAREDCA
jgi:hypothetical protein